MLYRTGAQRVFHGHLPDSQLHLYDDAELCDLSKISVDFLMRRGLISCSNCKHLCECAEPFDVYQKPLDSTGHVLGNADKESDYTDRFRFLCWHLNVSIILCEPEFVLMVKSCFHITVTSLIRQHLNAITTIWDLLYDVDMSCYLSNLVGVWNEHKSH